MKAYVGVTDGDWFQLLSELSPLDEVNFWQPGGSHRFGALQPGELFLFKLKSPRNVIAGGGIFAYSTLLPVSLAWESFGRANGANSLPEMRRRIERYRRKVSGPLEDYTIGCVLLTQPFFLSEERWIAVPPDWHPNIVQGKRYEMGSEPGLSLFRQVEMGLAADATGPDAALRTRDLAAELEDRYGKPVLVTPRLGQGSFRVLVTDAYRRRCAVTGERVLPVLEAAHIRPYAELGPHRVDNGILLRSDLHTLFDRGYLTVTEDRHLEVSRRIHEEFHNGRAYYDLRGRTIQVPEREHDWPSREYLRWHNEHVFHE